MTTDILAQKKGQITIFAGSRESHKTICEFDFDDNGVTLDSVGDDYLYTIELFYIYNDSEETDTLLFDCYAFDKIGLKEMSFSRNGSTYLSVVSFPIEDSVKWKLIKDENSYGDSLVLRDSLLYFKPEYPNHISKFMWHLKEKHVFTEGDSLRILLDEKPKNLRVDVQEISLVYKSTLTTTHKQCNTILLIGKESGILSSFLKKQQPLLDLQGRKYTTIPEGSGIVLPVSSKMRNK